MRRIILSYLLVSSVLVSATVLRRGKLPIAYCRGTNYVGFMRQEDGMWGDVGGLPTDVQLPFPELFSPRGDYSIVLFTCEYCPTDSTIAWIPIDRVTAALKKNLRLLCPQKCEAMLLDPRLYNVLKSRLAIERLEQILPARNGLCYAEFPRVSHKA